jgi:NAD/NADP octopine/nopaline dehydrogenase, alpha-helical domain
MRSVWPSLRRLVHRYRPWPTGSTAFTACARRRLSRLVSASLTTVMGPIRRPERPKSLDHKFTTEDVPTGLIPMSALGAPAGVATPAIDALVELVRKMTGKDFVSDARKLERLGLSGMDAPQIRRVMDEGFI